MVKTAKPGSAIDEPHASADVGEKSTGTHVELPTEQLLEDANSCTSSLSEECKQK